MHEREWLIILRKSKKAPQVYVSKHAHISQSVYSDYENGKKNPSVPIAKRIGAILDFDWRLFYEDDEEQISVMLREFPGFRPKEKNTVLCS